ncbi:MAG: YbjN domain-containing protein [Actinomycetota bacterium]|nr:YbjN domain-containing protein [Actinomycetota bacterium]
MPDDPTPVAESSAPAADAAKPRPAGEPEKVVELRGMIETKLAEIAGGYMTDQHGNYVLGMQSARTFIVPTWLENGATVVRVFAITNMAVPVTAELTSWLLAKNLEFVFGAFALDVDQGAVWFNHNLLGDFTAPEELEAAIAAVIETANRFDDEIKTRFGGRLYVEGAGDVVAPPAAPGYL